MGIGFSTPTDAPQEEDKDPAYEDAKAKLKAMHADLAIAVANNKDYRISYDYVTFLVCAEDLLKDLFQVVGEQDHIRKLVHKVIIAAANDLSAESDFTSKEKARQMIAQVKDNITNLLQSHNQFQHSKKLETEFGTWGSSIGSWITSWITEPNPADLIVGGEYRVTAGESQGREGTLTQIGQNQDYEFQSKEGTSFTVTHDEKLMQTQLHDKVRLNDGREVKYEGVTKGARVKEDFSGSISYSGNYESWNTYFFEDSTGKKFTEQAAILESIAKPLPKPSQFTPLSPHHDHHGMCEGVFMHTSTGKKGTLLKKTKLTDGTYTYELDGGDIVTYNPTNSTHNPFLFKRGDTVLMLSDAHKDYCVYESGFRRNDLGSISADGIGDEMTCGFKKGQSYKVKESLSENTLVLEPAEGGAASAEDGDSIPTTDVLKLNRYIYAHGTTKAYQGKNRFVTAKNDDKLEVTDIRTTNGEDWYEVLNLKTKNVEIMSWTDLQAIDAHANLIEPPVTDTGLTALHAGGRTTGATPFEVPSRIMQMTKDVYGALRQYRVLSWLPEISKPVISGQIIGSESLSIPSLQPVSPPGHAGSRRRDVPKLHPGGQIKGTELESMPTWQPVSPPDNGRNVPTVHPGRAVFDESTLKSIHRGLENLQASMIGTWRDAAQLEHHQPDAARSAQSDAAQSDAAQSDAAQSDAAQRLHRRLGFLSDEQAAFYGSVLEGVFLIGYLTTIAVEVANMKMHNTRSSGSSNGIYEAQVKDFIPKKIQEPNYTSQLYVNPELNEKIQELKARIQDYEHQEAKLLECEVTKEGLEAGNVIQKRQIKSYQEEKERLEEKCNQFEEKWAYLHNRYEVLTNEYQKSEQKCKEQQREHEKKIATKNTEIEMMNVNKEALETLEQDRENLSRYHENLKQVMQHYNDDYAKHWLKLGQCESLVNALKLLIDNLEAKQKKLKHDISVLNTKNDELRKETEELKVSSKAQIQAQQDELRKEKELMKVSSKAQIQAEIGRTRDKQAKLNTMGKERAKLQQQIKHDEVAHNALKERIDALEQQLRDSEKLAAVFQHEEAQTALDLNKKIKELFEHNEKIKELSAALSKINKEKSELEKDNGRYWDNIEKKRVKIRNLKTIIREQGKVIRKLEKEIERSNVTLAAFKTKSDEALVECKASRSQLEMLTAELKQVQQQLADVQAKNIDLYREAERAKELADKRAETEKLREELDRMQRADIERLEKENADLKEKTDNDFYYLSNLQQLKADNEKLTRQVARRETQSQPQHTDTKPPTNKDKWFYVDKDGVMGEVNIDDGRMGVGFGLSKIKGLHESMEELCRPLHIVSQGCKTAVDLTKYESVPRSRIRNQVIYGKSVYILEDLERYLGDLFVNSGYEPNAPYLACAHDGMLVEETETLIGHVKRMYSMCHKIKEVFNRLAPGDPFYEPFIVNNSHRHQEIHNLLTRNHTHLAKMDEKQLQALVESIQKIKKEEKPEEQNQTETKIKIRIHKKLAKLEKKEQKREDFNECVGTVLINGGVSKPGRIVADATALSASSVSESSNEIEEGKKRDLHRAFDTKEGTFHLTARSQMLWNKEDYVVHLDTPVGQQVFIYDERFDGPFKAGSIYRHNLVKLTDNYMMSYTHSDGSDSEVVLTKVYVKCSKEQWRHILEQKWEALAKHVNREWRIQIKKNCERHVRLIKKWENFISVYVRQCKKRRAKDLIERQDQKVRVIKNWEEEEDDDDHQWVAHSDALKQLIKQKETHHHAINLEQQLAERKNEDDSQRKTVYVLAFTEKDGNLEKSSEYTICLNTAIPDIQGDIVYEKINDIKVAFFDVPNTNLVLRQLHCCFAQVLFTIVHFTQHVRSFTLLLLNHHLLHVCNYSAFVFL